MAPLNRRGNGGRPLIAAAAGLPWGRTGGLAVSSPLFSAALRGSGEARGGRAGAQRAWKRDTASPEVPRDVPPNSLPRTGPALSQGPPSTLPQSRPRVRGLPGSAGGETDRTPRRAPRSQETLGDGGCRDVIPTLTATAWPPACTAPAEAKAHVTNQSQHLLATSPRPRGDEPPGERDPVCSVQPLRAPCAGGQGTSGTPTAGPSLPPAAAPSLPGPRLPGDVSGFRVAAGDKEAFDDIHLLGCGLKRVEQSVPGAKGGDDTSSRLAPWNTCPCRHPTPTSRRAVMQ